MFTKTIELFGKYRHLELTAITVSVATKIALEKDRILELLPSIQKLFPQLSESNYDDKKDIFKLVNDATETKDQMLFSVERNTSFVFSWGVNVSVGSEEHIRSLFDAFQVQLPIVPVNIGYIDARIHAVSEWEGNHYSLIWDAFFAKSPIHLMFAGQTIAQDDLTFRGILDDDKICLVEVQSNVNDNEIRQKKYENDVLKAKLAIAKTRNFVPDAKLSELAVQHITCFIDVARDSFAPTVVAPLDKALAALVRKGEK